MSTLLHRDPRNAVPELLEWLESPFMTLRPYLAQPTQPIRGVLGAAKGQRQRVRRASPPGSP